MSPRPHPLLSAAASCSVALALAACSVPAFGPADEAAIRGVMERQQAAWNAGDLTAFMTGYHRRPDIVFTSSGKIRRGYEDSLGAYRERYTGPTAKMGTLEFSDIEVTGLGAAAALVLGHFELTQTPQAGTGVFTLVFTQENGAWAIMHDHSSGAAAAEPGDGG